MRVRAQLAMVMNLDKCLGCHTCSVSCKNVWTYRKGVEYVWFNNVETKPGLGYPRRWEDQERWRGGWELSAGRLRPRLGGRGTVLAKLFANPHLASVDDYYEPFTFNYEHLREAPELEAVPVLRPRSAITGELLEVRGSANWEDDLGGSFDERSRDGNFAGLDREAYGRFERTFLLYLPRICEHCLNPSCVAACPSGSIYKRAEDGIVLVDQHKCRGWRMCTSGCPYKKVYYNWSSGKAEKCLLCYPRLEAGEPTLCAHSCTGRLRYLGVVLYDADRIAEAASVPERDLYEAQLGLFLDPRDEGVREHARRDGIAEPWLSAAENSPVYRLAVEWRLALPLHPEYRTLPMVWYVPSLSPLRGLTPEGRIGFGDEAPDLASLSLPVRYLANLLTAGEEAPVARALETLLALRVYGRAGQLEGRADDSVLRKVGLQPEAADEIYRLLALARLEERYVLPTTGRERTEDARLLATTAGLAFKGPFGGRP